EEDLHGLGQEGPALDALDGIAGRRAKLIRGGRVLRHVPETIDGVLAAQRAQGGRGPRALDLGPGLELDERDGFLERVAHPAVPLLGEGFRERGQRPPVARISHLDGSSLAHRPVWIGELRLPGKRVDQGPDRDAETSSGGDLLELAELHEERLAVGTEDGLAAVRGEERDQRLVALVDLVADDDGLFLATGKRTHIDTAFAEGFQEREELAVAGLAQGDGRRLLDGGVARGNLGD